MCTHTAQSSVLSNLIFNWHFIVLLIIFQFHDYTLHTQPAQRSTHFELVYYFFQFYSSKDFLWFSFLASKLYCTYCSLCCVVLNRKLCRSKTIFVCCCFCVLCSVILFCHWVKTVKPYCIHWKASVTVRVYMTNGTECRLCVAVNTQQK